MIETGDAHFIPSVAVKTFMKLIFACPRVSEQVFFYCFSYSTGHVCYGHSSDNLVRRRVY